MDEVELVCAVHGEGSVFPVTISRNAKVHTLREAVAGVLSTARHVVLPASHVTLYLARDEDGTWLKYDNDIHSFLQGPIHTAYKEMRMLSRLHKAELLGPDFEAMDEDIQILVEIPPHLYDHPCVLELYRDISWHTLMEVSSSASTHEFKAALCEAYDAGCDTAPDSHSVRCMLLDTALPSALVIASHLFRRRIAFLSETLMGFTEIDDVRNGLLLFEPLARAFDHFQISFIYDTNSREYNLKIMDPSVRDQRLFGTLDHEQRAILLDGQLLATDWRSQGQLFAPGTQYDLQTTFGDLDGRALEFRTTPLRPYKRCLNLQARLARKKALQAKWTSPDQDQFEDFWSEGTSVAAEKLPFE